MDSPCPSIQREEEEEVIHAATTASDAAAANSSSNTWAVPTESLHFRLLVGGSHNSIPASDILVLDDQPCGGDGEMMPRQLEHCMEEGHWRNFQQNLSDIVEERRDRLSTIYLSFSRCLVFHFCHLPCIALVAGIIYITNILDNALLLLLYFFYGIFVFDIIGLPIQLWRILQLEGRIGDKIIDLCRDMSSEDVTFHYREYQNKRYSYMSTYAKEPEFVESVSPVGSSEEMDQHDLMPPPREIEIHFYPKKGDNDDDNKNNNDGNDDQIDTLKILLDDSSQQQEDLDWLLLPTTESEDNNYSFVAHLQLLLLFRENRITTGLPLAIRPYISVEKWESFCATVNEIFERYSKRNLSSFILSYFVIFPFVFGFSMTGVWFFPPHVVPQIGFLIVICIVVPPLIVKSHELREKPYMKFVEEISVLCHQTSTPSITLEFQNVFRENTGYGTLSSNDENQTQYLNRIYITSWINVKFNSSGKTATDHENRNDNDGTLMEII